MREQNPVVRNYLEQFRANLPPMDGQERDELVREIESHIAEAIGAGNSVAEVLAKLGPADRLAKAYTVDQMLKSAPSQPRSMTNWFAVAGVLAATSLPSLVIIPLLLGLGVGLTMGGVGAVIAGVGSFFLPWLISDPFGFAVGIPQGMVIAVGIALTTLGVLSWWLLIKYLRFLTAAVRRVWSN